MKSIVLYTVLALMTIPMLVLIGLGVIFERASWFAYELCELGVSVEATLRAWKAR